MARFRRVRMCFFVLCFIISCSADFLQTNDVDSNPSQEDPNPCFFETKFTNRNGKIALYTLDNFGTFHRCAAADTPKSGKITYSVLKNGILVPGKGPYPIRYNINSRGDLIPSPSNLCIYKSEKATFYLRGKNKILIPVEIIKTGDKVSYVYHKNLLYSESVSHSKNSDFLGFGDDRSLPGNNSVVPDKMCNGDITLFLLGSNGQFRRNPPDEFLPQGMRLKYQLKEDGSLTPRMSTAPNALQLTYLLGNNGSLNPCPTNTHTLTTTAESTKSYILAEGGVLAPVSELIGNQTINYFYDGRLIHSSNQFNEAFSNATAVYLNERKKCSSETEVAPIHPGPRFECSSHKIAKRAAKNPEKSDQYLPEDRSSMVNNAFVYDDNGKRIVLEPFINDCGKVAIYKLTCKGYLKRLEAIQEPESGYEVQFKMLDSFILVPHPRKSTGFYLRYILQDNGYLKPVKKHKFSLKKAPACLLYFILTKRKELVPVRVNILKSNHIEIYYQDYLMHTIPPSQAKSLDIYTTIYAPLYAYCNSRICIIHSDPVPNQQRKFSTWTNSEKPPSISYPSKKLFLVGPNKTKTEVSLWLNRNEVPIIYDMDCNGGLSCSPKQDMKNMILRSYQLLPCGILMSTNDTNGYIYLIDREGNMLPYCYPDSKIRAPHGLTVKYVRCHHGILVPVLVEALRDHIRYSYENNVLYYQRAYSLDDIIDLVSSKDQPKDAESPSLDHKPTDGVYRKENGECVFYERFGKILRRRPSKDMSDQILDQLGCMRVKDGLLEPVDDPGMEDYIKVKVNPKGNLLVMENQEKVKLATCYAMCNNGSLTPVEYSIEDGLCKVTKNGEEIAAIKTEKWESDDDLKNQDPLGLFADKPVGNTTSKEPHQIIIPITEKVPTVINQEKCAQIRRAIQELLDKDGPSDVELEMSDQMMEQIYKMVCKCSKGNDSMRMKRDIMRLVREVNRDREES